MISLVALVLALVVVRRRPTRYGGGWFGHALRVLWWWMLFNAALYVAEWGLRSGFAAGLFEPGASIAWAFVIAAAVAVWLLTKRIWATTDPWSQTALMRFKRWMMR